MPDPNKRIQQAVQQMCGSWDKARSDWGNVPATCKDRVVTPAEAAITYIKAKINHSDPAKRLQLQKRAVTRFMDMFKLSYAPAYSACSYRATNGNQRTITNAGVAQIKMCMTDYLTGVNKLSFIMYTEGGKRDVKLSMTRDDYITHIRDLAIEQGGIGKKIISLPPALTKEIKLINKIFPKRWAKHLVDQAGRMYVTTIRELKISGVRPTANTYNEAAQKVVTRVRRMAWASVNKKQTVALAPATINDATAEAQYKKIAKAEKKPTQRAIFKNFMTVVTETFVLRADQVTDPADASKKMVKITFRRAPIKTYIDNGYTKELTRTGPSSKPRFTFFRKIKQTDVIRDQMTKALKRLYPQSASMLTAETAYDKNRKALDAKDSKNNTMIEKMTKATIKGMMKVFIDHYGLKGVGPNKVATVSKSDAAPMSLHELEAKDVILLKGSKNPDYVLFKLSHIKSTGGVPITVIRTIVDGYPGGNRALRAAAAIRRYQQAKAKLGDGAKDPAKLEKMTKTLVAQLKSLPDKKLMLSKVDKVAKDGAVTIVIANKALYPYMEDPKVLALGKKNAEARAKFKTEYVDVPELALIDVVDRIKAIFDGLADSNKTKLGDDAAKDALAKALVRHLVLKVKNNPKPQDGIGILWTKTGKGGSFKIKPTTVKVRVRKPARDARGRIKKTADGKTIYRWKTETKDGFKVSNIDLPDRFDGGKFSFPDLLTTKLGNGVTGTLTGMLYMGVNYMKDLGVFHYQIAEIGYKLKKGGFLAGFGVGVDNLHAQSSDRLSRATEGGPILNVPFTVNGPFDISRIRASAFMGYEGEIGKLTLSGKVTGGVLNVRPKIPGSVSRDLIDHNAVNATLGGSRMIGAMAALNGVFKDKKKDPIHKASLTLGAMAGKMTPAALKSKTGDEDSENPFWLDGAHVTAWLAGSYAYKKYFIAKAGAAYEKQMEGKLQHPALTGMLRVPAGNQVSGSVDVTITPLVKKKFGNVDLSFSVTGGLAGWTQKYERKQAPHKVNELLGYASAQFTVGTKFGAFSLYGAMNHLSGTVTSYLVTDPRTNAVTKQTYDYTGIFGGFGVCHSIAGLRNCLGLNIFNIKSSKAPGKEKFTTLLWTLAAPF